MIRSNTHDYWDIQLDVLDEAELVEHADAENWIQSRLQQWDSSTSPQEHRDQLREGDPVRKVLGYLLANCSLEETWERAKAEARELCNRRKLELGE